MESYATFRQRQQDIVDAFPFGAAFSDQQITQMMHKFGLEDTPEDRKKVIYIGAGCFVRKKDLKAMVDMFERIEAERKAYLADDDCFKDALEYEFGNHECQISHEWENALKPLGLTMAELTEHQKQLFKEARVSFWAKCVENDWF